MIEGLQGASAGCTSVNFYSIPSKSTGATQMEYALIYTTLVIIPAIITVGLIFYVEATR